MRLAGRVGADFVVPATNAPRMRRGAAIARSPTVYGFTAHGQAVLDARAETDWGPVRAYIHAGTPSSTRGRDAHQAAIQFGR